MRTNSCSSSSPYMTAKSEKSSAGMPVNNIYSAPKPDSLKVAFNGHGRYCI